MWSVGPCDKPLTIRLVNLDSEFRLSRGQAIDIIKQSIDIWNNNTGKEVASYDDRGDMPINFTYKTVSDLIIHSSDSSSRQIEQGNFENNSITIYDYQDKNSLIRLISHEIGHAIGLDHVSNSESIMYYLDSGTELKLSDEDITEYKKVCE